MKPIITKVVESHPKLVKVIIDFFTAKEIDKDRFDKIIQICSEAANEKGKGATIPLIIDGYLSVFDLLMYTNKLKLIEEHESVNAIEIIIRAMVEKNILFPLAQPLQALHQDARYQSATGGLKDLYKKDLIINLLTGWGFIITRYSSSVFKIEHEKKNGEKAIGTGFYLACSNGDRKSPLLITNKHVLEGAANFRIYDKEDHEYQFKDIKLDPARDLAYIELEGFLNCESFHLNIENDHLEEVITIGYPSIPMTKYAYQVYHRGEINSEVEDYSGNKIFLFSAKTSAGNSGSPLIDKWGVVLGIATRELFEKEEFYEKGKLPYYAAIPSSEINEFLYENNIIRKKEMVI